MSYSTSPKLPSQGRVIKNVPKVTHPATGPNSQGNRISHTYQVHTTTQRNPGQNRRQLYLQTSGQQLAQNPGGGSQVSSPKAVSNKSSFESAETEPLSESNKSKAALMAKGKGSVQGSGRGSFLYGGAQVIGASGNLGSGPGDQNFPAFLPCNTIESIYLVN